MLAGQSCESTTVPTIMSHRSLNTTDIADLPGGLPIHVVLAYPAGEGVKRAYLQV
jgi:hypothetical protein